MENRLIERFLSENSAIIPDNIVMSQATVVKARDRFRPDKVFGATVTMKWEMIVSGADSPYMLAKGRALPVPDSTSLKSELAELEEFEL